MQTCLKPQKFCDPWLYETATADRERNVNACSYTIAPNLFFAFISLKIESGLKLPRLFACETEVDACVRILLRYRGEMVEAETTHL